MAKYKLVRNGPEYWEFIRELRTMQGVSQGFISQEEITPVEQATYMLKYNSNYWICLDNDTPAGFVGVIDEDIRVATHPDYQGKGVGTFMINEIMKIIPTAFARVKLDNEASIKLFERCGFRKKYYILEKENEQV
tara:strand:- start:757 stop:1161 length:405 start_codon:yes stop_codon:yes gene_type:complete